MKNPELSDIYDAKIKDIETFSGHAQDPAHMQRARNELQAILNRLDKALGDHNCVAGETYSMADIVWTVGIARLIMIDVKPLENRPALQAWYALMKSRPSFAQAPVMERCQFSVMLAVLRNKFLAEFFGHKSSPAIKTETYDQANNG